MEIKYSLTPDEIEIASAVWTQVMSPGSISQCEWLATPVRVRAAVMAAMKTANAYGNPFELTASSADDIAGNAVPEARRR